MERESNRISNNVSVHVEPIFDEIWKKKKLENEINKTTLDFLSIRALFTDLFFVVSIQNNFLSLSQSVYLSIFCFCDSVTFNRSFDVKRDIISYFASWLVLSVCVCVCVYSCKNNSSNFTDSTDSTFKYSARFNHRIDPMIESVLARFSSLWQNRTFSFCDVGKRTNVMDLWPGRSINFEVKIKFEALTRRLPIHKWRFTMKFGCDWTIKSVSGYCIVFKSGRFALFRDNSWKLGKS